MDVPVTVHLSEITLLRLKNLSRKRGVVINDLIVEAVELRLDEELDRKEIRLSDTEFEEVLAFIESPTPADVKKRLAKTMATPFPWDKIGRESDPLS